MSCHKLACGDSCRECLGRYTADTFCCCMGPQKKDLQEKQSKQHIGLKEPKTVKLANHTLLLGFHAIMSCHCNESAVQYAFVCTGSVQLTLK